MKWMRVKVAGLVLAACVAGVMPLHAQRNKDPYVYEKLQEIEKHVDASDGKREDNAKDILALKEQIESYKDYALGFCGCFTLLVAALKFLGKKEEQSA